MSIPLLTTKLHIPKPKADTVLRPHLTRKLAKSCEGTAKLALVVAPAGFGKTTVLSTWHASKPSHPVAWLSLDDDDNDSYRFWSYAAAALETLDPVIPKGSLTRLPVGQLPDETILAHFINEVTAAPHPLTFVLDDFHVISNPEILAWLTFVIEHQPPNMHLIISTRAVPQLPLARPRAQGRLTEIAIQDLRFTAPETATFLRQTMGLNVDEQDIASLMDRTEGWIAGLQLAGLTLQGKTNISDAIEQISGANRYVADYFVEEVLKRQAPEVESFLIETAFLDTFTAPLCDTVTGRSDSVEIISMLEQQNLFIIPQDDQHEWYSYHRMFADLLRARQNERCTQVKLSDLHRRVSDWCLENDLLQKGISHALLAEDYVYALDLLNRHAFTLVTKGQGRTVVRWLEMFPPSYRQKTPDIDLLGAWACVAASRYNEVEDHLRHVESHLDKGWLTEEPAARRDLHGQVKAIRATVAMNTSDPERAVPLGQQALADLHPNNADIRSVVALDLADASLERRDLPEAVRLYRDALTTARPTGNAIISINAMSKLARLQFFQGNLHAAYESYHESLRSLQRWGWDNQPVAGMLSLGMAELLYEWNTPDQASAYADTALELLRQWGHPFHIAEAMILLGKIEHARGHPDLVEQYLSQATIHSRQFYLRHVERLVLETRARLALNVGDRLRARTFYDQVNRRFPEPLTDGSMARLALVRGLILNQDYRTAEAILTKWQTYTESHGLTLQHIETRILQATNALAQGKHDTALAALQDVLIQAEPGEFLRIFLDEGPPVRELLRRAKEYELEPQHYVTRLLDAFSTGHAVLAEPLSSREDEILHLIADQLSNQEIAEALFVSVNTVKTHIRRLYSKLSASNRLEAVTRAQELGIL